MTKELYFVDTLCMVLMRVIADFCTNPEGGPNVCNFVIMLIRVELRRSAKEPRALANEK